MRIAQVAPVNESIPPKAVGGPERVVSYLTEELVRMGHEVTLFASGDSLTTATLVPRPSQAPRGLTAAKDVSTYQLLQLQDVLRRAEDFDIIHFHSDGLHFPFARAWSIPTVTTLHGRLDRPSLREFFREYCDIPVVSVSMSQRTPVRDVVMWAGNVPHGLPREPLVLREQGGEDLVFLGRICPDRRLERAVEIAEKAGRRLRVAGNVDLADRKYFEQSVTPLLRKSHVEFVGEISERQKPEFLGRAKALLFPVEVAEPFSLAMVEAMACGTPAIGFPQGCVPEILEDGKTGLLARNVEEAVAAVARVDTINRAQVRNVFERRFSARRMAEEYVQVYAEQIQRRRTSVQNGLPRFNPAIRPPLATPRPGTHRPDGPNGIYEGM